MASPQLEDGYTPIANEILEALARTNLSAYQSRILSAILRKTYGYHKKEDCISNSQLVELTGLHKQHVWRTLGDLKNRNLVTKRGYFVGFNKDYTQWRELPKGVTSHQSNLKGLHRNLKGLPKVTKRGGHKIKKDNIQKKEAWFSSFDLFYKAYPKKKAPGYAKKAWNKLKPDDALFQTIMEALEKQKNCEDWKKERGKYIPHPASWLSGECWKDEIPEVKPPW